MPLPDRCLRAPLAAAAVCALLLLPAHADTAAPEAAAVPAAAPEAPPARPPSPAAPSPSAQPPSPPAAVLPAPQWVGAVDARGKAQLTWIPNPALPTVRIYRRWVEGGGPFELLGETKGNTWVDSGVVLGATYRYRLVGVGPGGKEGRPSAELGVRIASFALKSPTPPAWEGYLPMPDGVGLKWSAREDEDVIAYNIYRRDGPDEEFRLIGSSRGTSFRDTGLEPGRSYVYALTALDSGFRETNRSEELPVTLAEARPAPAKGPEPVWRVRRTRLVSVVTGGDAPFLRPADVAVGPATGAVYVADSGQNRVFVFSARGVFQRTIGVSQAGATVFRKLLGLALDRDETLYAVDAGAGAVQTFTRDGAAGRRFELPRPDGTRATGLIDAAPAPGGALYVVDNLNSRVSLVSREGATAWFGKAGYEGGQLSAPTFCATDAEGNLVVAEALNARVQTFSPAGEFVRAFGRYSRGPGGLGRPKGVAVSAAGEIYVADSWLNTVQVFDASGRFLAILGDETGNPLDLGSPNGVALGRDNLVYVAERLSARLQVREIVDAP